jgi:hypothetical protein
MINSGIKKIKVPVTTRKWLKSLLQDSSSDSGTLSN